MKLLPLLLLAMLPSASIANDQPPRQADIEIRRETHFNKLPAPEILGKRLHIECDGSPKLSLVLQERLRSLGYSVVSSPSEAEAKYRVSGIFLLSGAGKQDIRGKLGELTESSLGTTPGTPDYQHQNVDLLQIGVSIAKTGIASMFSLSDMVRWLGQKTGIAGRFNELLTGDPRGFCVGEHCDQYEHTLIMNMHGDGTHWWIQGKSQHPKLILDLLLQDQLTVLMKPFADLAEKK